MGKIPQGMFNRTELFMNTLDEQWLLQKYLQIS